MEASLHTSTTEEFAIFERVARIVSSVRGTRPDYTRLAAELELALPFDVFGVVLLRHDRQAVRVTVCQRKSNIWVAGYHQHPLEDSRLEYMLRNPALMVKNYPNGLDGPPVASGDALSGYHQLRSTLIAPLLVEERVLGTLELGSVAVNAYEDIALQRLADSVARVLATAIERAQLGGSAEIQDRQRQALKDVSSALASKTDLTTILEQIVQGIATALNVSSAIVTLNRAETGLHLEAQSGLNEEALSSLLRDGSVLSDDHIIGYTLRRRLPMISPDIEHDTRFPASRLLVSGLGLHSLYCYPLVTGSVVYGVLLLCSAEPGGFTPLKADIFSLFASQATIAIHNGMLLDSARQRQRFQGVIEHLEQAQVRHIPFPDGSGRGNEETRETEEELADELALLKQVRQETERTFGVSFSSLLRFISEHLLTHGERDLQAHLVAYQRAQDEEERNEVERVLETYVQQEEDMPDKSGEPALKRWDLFADNLSLLTRTAEAALVRAGVLGELSRLLIQLKQSTDVVKDAWFVVDLTGTCMYMNPAAEVLCRTRIDDVEAAYAARAGGQGAATIEHVFSELLPRIRNRDEVRLYLQDFTQGNVYRQELRCVVAAEPVTTQPVPSAEHKRGGVLLERSPSDYHYQLVRYPLYNQQGQLVANALQVCDVSEQVRDERNRSTLLSSVSHELRTPLTAIKAAVTGLLQDDVAWSEQDRRGMLEDIDVETDHLTVLVNGIVEMSRIEMGALILEKEWCDIVEVVYGTFEKMRRIFGQRRPRALFSSRLPLIYADHLQLERVFYNLLENAARYSSEQADITIEFNTVTEALEGRPPQQYLRVKMINYGYSMPKFEREQLFKSIYGVRSYSDGLGLAICKGIIEAHQGKIWVEAEAEGGTCFVFFLPVHPYYLAHPERTTKTGVTGEKCREEEEQ